MIQHISYLSLLASLRMAHVTTNSNATPSVYKLENVGQEKVSVIFKSM